MNAYEFDAEMTRDQDKIPRVGWYTLPPYNRVRMKSMARAMRQKFSNETFLRFTRKLFLGLGLDPEHNSKTQVTIWWVLECLADSDLYDCKEEADEIFAAIQSWRNRKRDPDW